VRATSASEAAAIALIAVDSPEQFTDDSPTRGRYSCGVEAAGWAAASPHTLAADARPIDWSTTGAPVRSFGLPCVRSGSIVAGFEARPATARDSLDELQ
jgi:hypothetical protein